MNHAGVMDIVPEVMISPKTLNSWLERGYGVDTYGYSRMVILDVDSRTGYAEGHVPGAYMLALDSNYLWSTRSNGITEIPFQVPTRASMDEIIRKTGIDTDAVIVITGSSMAGIARAYFVFRYWGFPRRQLKVLNGTKTTYAAVGYVLQTEDPPTPVPCQFSVCSNEASTAFSAVRASFAEMLEVAEDVEAASVIIDARSLAEYAGKPGSTKAAMAGNEYVVFEGHIRTAVNIPHTSLLVAENETNPLLPPEDLSRVLNPGKTDGNKTFYVYGTYGRKDTVLFLALDAVLSLPVKVYDGGWFEWGQMAGNMEKGGKLLVDSPWRTDTAMRSEAITYNKPHGFPVITGSPINAEVRPGNLINREDAEVCDKAGEPIISTPTTPGY